ncbi:retropepsin-like domain-containing protein [Candidatus Poribacteria bacterium]|nr:retropepsin-like domain-containing protein [Candidatus Poribacteria bacterium]
MLIDSGADVSVITKQTGIRLGLTISPTDQMKSLGGTGGRIPVIYRQIEMQIGPHSFQAEVGWIQNDQPLLILGRRDVFSSFSIEFREFENLVIFRHISELS